MSVLQTIIDEVLSKYEMTGRETDNIIVDGATNDEIKEAIEELNLRDNFGFTLQKYSDILPASIRYTTTDKDSFILRQKLALELNELANYLKNYETLNTPATIEHFTSDTQDTYVIDIEAGQYITLSIK